MDFVWVFCFGSPLFIFSITLIQGLTFLAITAYAVPAAEKAFVAISAIAYIQLHLMNSKAEIIEEVDEGGVSYSVYIVTVISPYYYLIETKPECFHITLGVEIEVPM